MSGSAIDRRRLTRSLAPIVVVLVVVLVYWPGLNGPLILDDASNLSSLRTLDALGRLSFISLMQDRGEVIAARPVSMLSFLWNWKLTGDDVWFLKLTNLLVHLACGAVLYVLSRCLLERSDHALTSDAHWIATWIAAAWLLTPMQVTTVLYVVQRMAQLATLFSLLGLAVYVVGRVDLERRPRRALALMGSAILVCWPLATLSKENGVLLPLLLLLSEVYFFRPPSARNTRRLLYGVLGACAIAPWLAVAASVALDPQWLMGSYAQRDFTLAQRLLTQPRVLADYLLNVLLLPGGSPLGLFHDDFAKSQSLLRPWSTVVAIGAWTAAVLVALKLRATTLTCIGYGLMFFLLAHSIEAGIFALELYFEHRNYLPSAGLFIALGGIAIRLSHVLNRRGVIQAALLLVIVGYSVTAGARVLVWTSWDEVLRTSAVLHPRSIRAQSGVAVIHLRAGRLEQASIHLQRVLELGGEQRRYGVILQTIIGHCIAERAVPQSLYRELSARPEILDDYFTVASLHWLRAMVLRGECGRRLDLGRLASTLSRHVSSRSGRGRTGQNWSLHYDTARLLMEAGRPADAREHLLAGQRHAPPSQLPVFEAALEHTTRP